MVKFGRHVDFFVANELLSGRDLYVVPYKEIQHKTCLVPQPKQAPPPPAMSPLLSSTPTNYGNHPWFNDDADLDSPGVMRRHNSITLNNASGEDLASTVRQMMIENRQQHSQHSSTLTIHLCNENKAEKEVPECHAADAHFIANRFQTEWRICLKRASVDFDRAMKLLWSEVFRAITVKGNMTEAEEDAIRGVLPDDALQMYVASVTMKQSQELFSFLKDIHATALLNAESLRKLVKKFDKLYRYDNQTHRLSATLLPEVYSCNFTVALPSLEAGLTLMRALLGNEDDDLKVLDKAAILAEDKRLSKLATMDKSLIDVAVLSGGYFRNSNDFNDHLVTKRKEELIWLRSMVKSIDPVYIPFLVAHRGFHSIHDRSDIRPLENSLMAYEAAWTNGLHLCECDIALTKDERIILAHDENFARLGMDPTSPLCNRTVRDLTFKDLMNCPLKCGARPPLLFDVLRSAVAIGDDAKMIVEIKAGNIEACSALGRMFVRHPQLMDHVAVIMSFDAFIMHNMRREMAKVYENLQSHPTQMVADTIDAHPLKRGGSFSKTIALGSTLSSSPILTLSALSHNRSASLSSSSLTSPLFQPHHRMQSHNCLLPLRKDHIRFDSRDHFGLGYPPKLNPPASSLTSMLSGHEAPSHTVSKVNLNCLKHGQQEQKLEPPDKAVSLDSNTQNRVFPKLLLITVANTPKTDYELHVDITDEENLSQLDGWLRGGDGGTLDGVYMQFQKIMLEREGSEIMRSLASRYDIGIWGANPTPDDWETFHRLVTECHVSFVNTGLPRHFKRKVPRSFSADNLTSMLNSKE